jgi:putative endonuclease
MSKTQKQITGARGEQQAVDFLIGKGYKIIDRNWQLKNRQELDIIAKRDVEPFGETLVFVEVKTREKNDGNAERATRGEKLKHMQKAAHTYCMYKKIDIDRTPIQFEQVSVYGSEDSHQFQHYVIPIE